MQNKKFKCIADEKIVEDKISLLIKHGNEYSVGSIKLEELREKRYMTLEKNPYGCKLVEIGLNLTEDEIQEMIRKGKGL